ncbi:hypothetical protein MN116_005398 [Schistosoma mekongi]|uniref:C2 domain-containing protein n=1 Tax=Schistosoma mekongi TaxID=38744 RepID=A0AAE1ZDU5_SCHME|nr:hypothetical protein MN116_005398 [Schistosoma mekongi]
MTTTTTTETLSTTSITSLNSTNSLNTTFNSSNLDRNPFIINLANSFHVINKPLAIFILICICLICILFIIIILLCIRKCIQHRYKPKVLRKRPKGIYIDEIPGLIHNIEQSKYGTLEYSLEYNLDKKQLKVGILQCNNLIGPINCETLNPYTTITLAKYDNNNLCIIGKQYKTNILSNTNHPVWKQIFTYYNIEEYELMHIIIIFEVFTYDNNLYEDINIGKLEIYLKNEHTTEYIGNIIERMNWLTMNTLDKYGLGELCLGIGYYPLDSRIDICIYECRQLNINEYLTKSKQYQLDILILCKYHQQIIQRQHTIKRKELINPYFNQKFSIQLKNNTNHHHHHIEDYHIVCQLRHINRLHIKSTLGNVYIGLNAKQTTGIKQWEEIIKNPSKIHVMWHTIVPC